METIDTKAYGKIKVEENSAIHFKKEILGFDTFHNYYLIEMGDLPNYYRLQSKDVPELSFIIVDPRLFMPDYVLDIDESDAKLLEMEKDDPVIDFVIVNTIDYPKITINLLGPIVINANKRIAVQAISLNNDYGTKVPILNPVAENEKGEGENAAKEHPKKEEHKKEDRKKTEK